MSRFVARLKLLGLTDALVRRNPLLYRSAVRHLAACDAVDETRRARWVQHRLRRVLAAAAATRYGASVGAPGCLDDWPVLEKDRVRLRPGDFLRGRGTFSVHASTSGTTGAPLELRRSLGSVVYEQAVLDRLVHLGGIDPLRCRSAVLRGDDVKPLAEDAPPFWRLAQGGRRLVLSSNHLNARTLGHYLAELRRFAPEVLFAYPTSLESLCSLMLERGETLAIPLTLCGSEILTAATAELARRALGTRVLGYYGQAERVAWCWGDPQAGYRFLPSYSVNELRLLERGREGDVYELLGTGLWNFAMPLVRYRTHDRVVLAPGADPEEVARGGAGLRAILGRSGDYLVSPEGARLTGVDHIPREVPHLVRVQFVQESADSVLLLVLPQPGFDERCRRVLLAHAARKLPPSMRVRIETTAELLRNASGKAPLVVRRIDPAGGAAAAPVPPLEVAAR